jgi:predicted Zn finger-like uncharacterized protein
VTPIVEEKIITQCPHCKSKFKLDGEKVGKKIRCPKCSGVFEVQPVGAEAKSKPVMQEASAKPQPVAAKPKSEPVAKPTPSPAAKPKPAPEPAAAKTPPPPKEEPKPAAPTVIPLDKRPRPLKPKDFFETQFMRFLPEKAAGVDAHIWYELTGEDGGSWTVIIRNGGAEVKAGPDPSAKTHVVMADKTYMKLATNKLDSRVAFMLGKIKIKGDKQSVVSVRECFEAAKVDS